MIEHPPEFLWQLCGCYSSVSYAAVDGKRGQRVFSSIVPQPVILQNVVLELGGPMFGEDFEDLMEMAAAGKGDQSSSKRRFSLSIVCSMLASFIDKRVEEIQDLWRVEVGSACSWTTSYYQALFKFSGDTGVIGMGGPVRASLEHLRDQAAEHF